MASHENFEGVFLHSDVEIEHINYKNENHALILKQWMQDLPEKIHNLPLNCIAIPGSHESGTYSVSAMDDYAPDGLFLSKSRAVQLLGSTAKKVICGWMKTQDLTCKEQLEIGIRYFDFKVATKPGSSDLYIVHGLYGDSMTSVLDSIKEFLDLHPKEVVLLHFQQLFAMTNDDHHRLLRQITEVFGSKVCPVVPKMEKLTLSWLWHQQYQVLVFYMHDVANYHPFLWKKEFILSSFPKAVKGSDLMQFLVEQHKQENPLRKFVVSQGVLTPTATFILRHPCSNFRDHLVDSAHEVLQEWLKGKKDLNIVISDFVDIKDCWFPRTVVGMNYNRPLGNDEVNGKSNIIKE